MKIHRLSTRELRRLLASTERAAGPQSASAVLLRRELDRRTRGRGRPSAKLFGKTKGGGS